MCRILRCFIATALLAVPVAGSSAEELYAVQGRENPASIPEWISLKSVMRAADLVLTKYPEDGARTFGGSVGISESAVRTLVAHYREQKAAENSEATLKSVVCPKYASLTAKEALSAEGKRFDEAMNERSRKRTEGVYDKLNAEDASRLREHVLMWRKNVSIVKGDRPLGDDPIAFLTRTCGAAP